MTFIYFFISYLFIINMFIDDWQDAKSGPMKKLGDSLRANPEFMYNTLDEAYDLVRASLNKTIKKIVFPAVRQKLKEPFFNKSTLEFPNQSPDWHDRRMAYAKLEQNSWQLCSDEFAEEHRLFSRFLLGN